MVSKSRDAFVIYLPTDFLYFCLLLSTCIVNVCIPEYYACVKPPRPTEDLFRSKKKSHSRIKATCPMNKTYSNSKALDLVVDTSSQSASHSRSVLFHFLTHV